MFFHAHPLKLEDQDYLMEKSSDMCGFCEESMEGSAWGYSCEQCNFYVHSLCTKYPKSLTHDCFFVPPRLEQTPDAKSLPQPSKPKLLCRLCNGGDLGRYCYNRTLVGLGVFHPFCAILGAYEPVCIHDSSHRLNLVFRRISFSRDFYRNRCGEVGLSAAYHCDHCNVDIHMGCLNVMEDEEVKWIEAYVKFMAEYGAKDYRTKLDMILAADMISELLDIMLVGNALEEGSSSSSRPQRGI